MYMCTKLVYRDNSTAGPLPLALSRYHPLTMSTKELRPSNATPTTAVPTNHQWALATYQGRSYSVAICDGSSKASSKVVRTDAVDYDHQHNYPAASYGRRASDVGISFSKQDISARCHHYIAQFITNFAIKLTTT
jgi:hypothetical protein